MKNLVAVSRFMRKPIDKMKCSALKSFPDSNKTKLDVNGLLQLVNGLNVCAGHSEQQFLDLADSCKGKFQSVNQSIVSFTDAYFPIHLNREVNSYTIHTTTCELLVHGEKCDA